MISVRIDMSGLDRAVERIGALEERVRKPQKGLRIVADVLSAHVEKQFETSGRHAQTPWKPLAPFTVRQRKLRVGYYKRRPTAGVGATGPILTWTGAMRRSFQERRKHHVRQITEDSLVWGTRHPFVDTHQKGKKIRGRVIPKRLMLAFRDAQQKSDVTFLPLRLWLQGVPEQVVRATVAGRTGLTLK